MAWLSLRLGWQSTCQSTSSVSMGRHRPALNQMERSSKRTRSLLISPSACCDSHFRGLCSKSRRPSQNWRSLATPITASAHRIIRTVSACTTFPPLCDRLAGFPFYETYQITWPIRVSVDSDHVSNVTSGMAQSRKEAIGPLDVAGNSQGHISPFSQRLA